MTIAKKCLLSLSISFLGFFLFVVPAFAETNPVITSVTHSGGKYIVTWTGWDIGSCNPNEAISVMRIAGGEPGELTQFADYCNNTGGSGDVQTNLDGQLVRVDLYTYDGEYHFFSSPTVQLDENGNYNATPGDTEIVATPEDGSVTVGSPFTVDVAVNAGEEFNAARATVAVSSNLTVNSISNPTSNACNLHYTTTPTTSNPSFAGAIFGDSSEDCNVYSMVITPNEEGTGTITFTNGSVKAYGDNSEILTGVQNASFTIEDGPTATPTPDLGFTIASVLPTYNATYPLTGTKLTTITSIFVNGEDTNSTYPTSTSWENMVNLSLGENTFTIYGSDGTNQTATQTVSVDRHTLGDINGDNEIDLIDASLFAVDWDKTEDLTYNLSDMNDDGVVDLTDLSILAKLQ